MLLFVVVPAHRILSSVYTVSVAPQSTEITVRECDDLVFVLTVSGTYISSYDVTVQCLGGGKLHLHDTATDAQGDIEFTNSYQSKVVCNFIPVFQRAISFLFTLL